MELGYVNSGVNCHKVLLERVFANQGLNRRLTFELT